MAKVSSVNNLSRRRRDFFFFFGTDLSSDVLIARLAGTGKLKIHTTAAEDKYRKKRKTKKISRHPRAVSGQNLTAWRRYIRMTNESLSWYVGGGEVKHDYWIA